MIFASRQYATAVAGQQPCHRLQPEPSVALVDQRSKLELWGMEKCPVGSSSVVRSVQRYMHFDWSTGSGMGGKVALRIAQVVV